MGTLSCNSELLFFILIYLLLFYDNRPLLILRGYYDEALCCEKNSSALFFILIFLLLFY